LRPLLFEWRGVRIWSYPACFCLGVVLGVIAQNAAANAAGLNSARVYAATLLLLPVALAGARLLHVASHWPAFRRDPRRIWRRSEGGMAMYGGLPCMLLGSLPLLAWLRVPFWRFWDVSVFCILVGMMFTRIGCLLNGCCCGRPAAGPLALWLPDERGLWQRRVPTQLLEAGVAALLLAVAVAIGPATYTSGTLFLLILGGYGLARMALHPLRAQRARVGRLDLQVSISALLVTWSLVHLWLLQT
jgi:phosphatidylglycerol:prolipoprotein diacylglycerol transferase